MLPVPIGTRNYQENDNIVEAMEHIQKSRSAKIFVAPKNENPDRSKIMEKIAALDTKLKQTEQEYMERKRSYEKTLAALRDFFNLREEYAFEKALDIVVNEHNRVITEYDTKVSELKAEKRRCLEILPHADNSWCTVM